MHLTRNQAYLYGYRGFESLPLRQHSGPSSAAADSGFRLRAPASLTPATRLKFESLPPRHRICRINRSQRIVGTFRHFRANSRLSESKRTGEPPRICDLSPISMADVRDLTTEELFAVLQPGVEESVKATLEKFIGCELEESIGG